MADVGAALLAGVRGRCPKCGEGGLFRAYLKLADACPKCGTDFRMADPGDGPAVFVILIVGALVVPFAFVLQIVFDAPIWVSALVTCLLTLLLSVVMLPLVKATLFTLQWTHKAGEGKRAGESHPEP